METLVMLDALCIETAPCPIFAGSILSIATVMFKVPEEEFCGEYRVDPERCFCFDEYFTHQISFLRVFYKLGQPAYEVIGKLI